ncbi:MAG TPA: glycosyltransferase family 4 protein, partial [Thermodesulfobacteriota bacterium]|nr:glycosyltransferase family 4 protein [Thermodesulfobacteriota bacterium]
DKVMVYVGRLIGLKGVKVLLKAIDAIARRQNGVKLLIIGDGEEKGSLAGLAEAMGIANRVFFAGFIPNSELPRYYSVAKIGVFPTLADEAFGISICEAMACGVPVVATRVGGIPEVVDDGVSGFLVPPGKEEELAERIETLLDDDLLGKRMGALAVEAIHERFTWEKVADRLTRVYRTVFA